MREFDDVFRVAVFIFIFTNAWKVFWTTKNAGAPLARLFARRDLIGFLTNVALGVAVYYVSAQALWPYSWCYYGAALLYVYFAFNALTYYFMTELDLRTEGIVMVGAFRWPWRGIRVTAAERGSEAIFVLRRRWRRVIATVPHDEADLVGQVLQEKFEANASA
jgi:hypothetical protein